MAKRSEVLTIEFLNYLAHMPSGDDLVLIVLKGHLLIEQQLEEIIRTIVAHGELLQDTRMSFDLKATLAEAMCWVQHTNPMWAFIFSLNTLRNDFAHSLGSDKTEPRLKRALDAYAATLDVSEKAEMNSLTTADRLRHAIGLAMGFLGSYAGDAHAYRVRTDAMYAALGVIGREMDQAAQNSDDKSEPKA